MGLLLFDRTWSRQSTPRPPTAWVALTLVIVVLLLLPHSPELPRPTLSQLTTGRWIPRYPRYISVEEILSGEGTVGMMECDGTRERLLGIANWVFEADEVDRWEWDQEEVIKKLLSMPEGLIIVGDSLADQLRSSILSQLSLGVLTTQQQVLNGTLSNGKTVILHRTISLVPSHPLYHQLLQSKSFSSARLARPVLQMIRSHHLVSDEELGRLVPSSHPDVANVSRVGYTYGSDPDWISIVEDAIKECDGNGGERGSKECTSRTVVVVNSGPHWHPNHFDPVDVADLDVSMNVGYSGMVKNVMERLPDDEKLHLIVHLSNAVEDQCSQDPSPADTSSTLLPLPDPILTRYNYRLFPLFDEYWKDAIDSYRSLTRISILDDRAMMSRRSEAKKSPTGGDCLHYCIPALHETARIVLQYIL